MVAAAAGASTAIATYPLWVVKTRSMKQGMRPDVVPYKSIQKDSELGLYGNVLPSLVGVSHVTNQFPAYEKIKQYMVNVGNTSVDKLSPGNVAVASSISKVVRSKLQGQGQVRNVEARVFSSHVLYQESV